MKERPNILFLLSDEHSFRCFSYLDQDVGEPVSTPTLDRLAMSSAVFDQAYCQVPLCTPSRICLLTGREAAHCGAWNNKSILRPGMPTLPETLANAGYTTCLVGKMHLGGNRQFCGFQHRPYGDLTGGAGHQLDPIDADARHPDQFRCRTVDAGITTIPESLLQEQVLAREAIAFLREHRYSHPDQPWFMCASFSRPHFPLTAPSRYFGRYWPNGVTPPKIGRTGDTVDHSMTMAMAKHFKTDEIGPDEMMRARAAYFGCVDYLDEIIGDLLTTLNRDGLLDNTIVIYTTDHGELAGEHGMWWKQSWHEASTRVPLFIQLPDHRTGRVNPSRLTTPVSLIDLFPTLCGLTGTPIPDGLDGTNLADAVLHGAEPDRGPVFSEKLLPNWGPGTEYRMVRAGDYKYVGFRNAPELLFNLASDPLEQKNLANVSTPEVAEVLAWLRTIAADTIDFDLAERDRLRDQANDEHRLEIESAPANLWNNAFLLPDGRLIDADSMLYDPKVIAADPSQVFADWPG